MPKWCTVTVTDCSGQRYSLDVNATSSYDAAHLYLTHVTQHPGCGMPIPTTSTDFEVITEGKVPRTRRQAEGMDREAAAGLEGAARFSVLSKAYFWRLEKLFIALLISISLVLVTMLPSKL